MVSQSHGHWRDDEFSSGASTLVGLWKDRVVHEGIERDVECPPQWQWCTVGEVRHRGFSGSPAVQVGQQPGALQKLYRWSVKPIMGSRLRSASCQARMIRCGPRIGNFPA